MVEFKDVDNPSIVKHSFNESLNAVDQLEYIWIPPYTRVSNLQLHHS